MSLIELMVACSLFGGLSILFGTYFLSVTKGGLSLFSKANAGVETSQAFYQIMKVGRHSGGVDPKGCETVDTQTLRCYVNAPSFGGQKTFQLRYLASASALVFEVGSYPLPSTPNFQEKHRYQKIASFLVCDYAALQAVKAAVATPCSVLSPQVLGNAYVQTNLNVPNANNNPPNRFFRFRLVGSTQDPSATMTDISSQIVLQGAFYVRNPSPVGAMSWYEMGP